MRRNDFLKITCIFTAILALSLACLTSCFGSDKKDPSKTEPPETTPPVTTTAKPVTTTAATTAKTLPSVTQPPVKGKNLSISGSILPEGRSPLGVHVEWSASQSEKDENAILTFKIFLDCYSIHVAERRNCELVVNDKTLTFNTPTVTREENSKASYEIATLTHSIPNAVGSKTTVKVSVSYPFGGVYGDKKIDTLTASGTITLDQSAATTAKAPAVTTGKAPAATTGKTPVATTTGKAPAVTTAKLPVETTTKAPAATTTYNPQKPALPEAPLKTAA